MGRCLVGQLVGGLLVGCRCYLCCRGRRRCCVGAAATGGGRFLLINTVCWGWFVVSFPVRCLLFVCLFAVMMCR